MTSFWQRLRDEAEQRWYVPARTAEILFLVPLAGSLLLLATAPSRALFVGITHEDGVLEWAEVAAWLLVIPFALAMFWHLWHDDGRRWLAMPYLLLALGAIFVTGEEISWGQRILGIDTPSSIRSENEQGETTLHNMRSVHQEYRLALFLVGAYGSIFVYAAGDWVQRRWPDAFNLYLPPLFLTSGFLVQAIYRGMRLLWIHEPTIYLWGFAEWPEFCMPMAIAAFAVLNLRRHRIDERAPSEAAPAHRDIAPEAGAT